jgi:molybdopterin converting factor small subunit
MSVPPPEMSTGRPVGTIVVRYWAAARAAAGVESDMIEVGDGTTLAAVLQAVRELHADRPRLRDVVSVCSVLVGDRPVGSADPHDVPLRPGDTIELLPPFAGG